LAKTWNGLETKEVMMTNQKWWGDYEGVGFPNLVASQQFDKEHLLTLFQLSKVLKRNVPKGTRQDWLKGCTCLNLFSEPSTRTRGSNEMSEGRLGAAKISFDNDQFSSAVKGESKTDAGLAWHAMEVDIIVMRHKDENAALDVARCLSHEENPPAVINGGDGKGQHPTQALLDLFTIFERFEKIDNLTIAMVGDLLRGRTVRSLAYMLSKFTGVKIIFVSSRFSKMGQDVKDYLNEHGVIWSETENLVEAARQSDVVYMTRPQLERERNLIKRWLMRRANRNLTMTKIIAEQMPMSSIIMHPFPRNEEIETDVDSNERAWYFWQMRNGVYIRMAIMLIIGNPTKAKELLAQAG